MTSASAVKSQKPLLIRAISTSWGYFTRYFFNIVYPGVLGYLVFADYQRTLRYEAKFEKLKKDQDEKSHAASN